MKQYDTGGMRTQNPNTTLYVDPFSGIVRKTSTSYLGNKSGSQQKLVGFGHGAPPRDKIR